MPIKYQSFLNRIKVAPIHSNLMATALLLASMYSAPLHACPYVDTRICSADIVLRSNTNNHVVTYTEIKNESENAESGTEWVIGAPDIIHLSNTESYSQDELLFLMAHEFNHSFKRHMRLQLESVSSTEDRILSDVALFRKNGHLMGSAQKAFRHQLEYESDEFAVRLLFKLGKDPIAVMQALPIIDIPTQSHPSKKSRIQHADETLKSLRTTEWY